MKTDREGEKDVATIVLAGGQGTRLYPLTAKRCKPAVSFGGRYRLIDIPLSNSLNAKIYQIFVISQYFASELHQHILSTYQLDMFHRGGIELLTPQETSAGKTWFRGTADAVRQNLEYLIHSSTEYFLILSGDQLYNMDLIKMVEFAKATQADFVIASYPVAEAEARRMGVLKVNTQNAILDFYEKPQDPEILRAYKLPNESHWLGSMGIYLFKRSALIDIMKLSGDDFGRHLIPQYIKKCKAFAFTYDGYWEDIGTVSSYYDANLILTEKGKGLDTYDMENPIYSAAQHLPGAIIDGATIRHSIISPGGWISASEITHSVIGLRACIKKGTVIKDSVVIGNKCYISPEPSLSGSFMEFSIGENCIIEKSIIDEQTHIGNNVKLLNKNQVKHLDGEGIFIRDGIIIVTQGTSLPDGYVL